MKTPVIIAIDGPAGSGKSTVARLLSQRLGIIHLNSGLLYRAVANAAIERNVSLDDEAAVTALAEALTFRHSCDRAGATHFLVNGEDISARLAAPEVSRAASRIAVYPGVRDRLTEYQRDLGGRESLVLEGRDAGTVVFPDTPWKFYLEAAPEIRAERRLKEQGKSGSKGEGERVLRELEERDRRDQSRAIAPAVPSKSAIVIDTAAITPEEVLAAILGNLS
jgi:cytidylate kinase